MTSPNTDVYTLRGLIAMSDADFDELITEVRKRRKERAAHVEGVQREAEKAARKLVSASQHEEQAAWARRNL
jgi:hypothetical protein